MKKIIIALIIFGLFFSLFPINVTVGQEIPPLPNIVGYWGLDKAMDDIAVDSSDNHYNGTLINMEIEDWITGKIGKCLDFDGVNEYVDLGNIAGFEYSDSFSIEYWIKTITCDTTYIVTKGITTKGWFIYTINGKLGFLLIYDFSNYLDLYTTINYNNDNWHHVIYTYNGNHLASGVKIYVDNILQDVTVIKNNLGSKTILNSANCQINGYNGATLNTACQMDEVVIYNKTLSQNEVDFRYNDGDGRGWVDNPPNKPICISPPDKKLNININTTLKTKVIDMDNDNLSVTLYLDDIFLENFSNVANNTIIESSILNLEYSRMYTWYVEVEDENYITTSDTFIFATISEPEPVIPNIPPEKPLLILPNNNSINVSINTRLKSHVNDIDDDFLSVTFYWENNTEIQSLLSITNYTIQTHILDLDYNTSYSWYVIVSDFIDYNISDVFTFTTETEPVDDDIEPPLPVEIDYSILFIGICLAIIVFVLEFFSNKLKIEKTKLLSVIELALILIIISIMIFLKFS